MKHATKFIVISLSLTLGQSSIADWQQDVENTWKNTRQASQKAFEKSRHYGKQAYDQTKVYSKEAYETSKQYITEISQSLKSQEHTPVTKPREERFNAIWSDLLHKMTDARNQYDAMQKAPESAWFKDDKSDYREDFNVLLDEMLYLLEDESVYYTRQKVQSLQDMIKEKQAQISKNLEQRIIAPIESSVKTTKSDYDKHNKNLQSEIAELKKEIYFTKVLLASRLRDLGINLSEKQVSQLLSRVDSDNIIDMSVAFEILKDVTEQLAQLTENSGENIDSAKKYYGMYVVLMETVVHMQNKYIEQVDKQFVPKLDDIILKTKELKAITKNKLKDEEAIHRKNIYQKNYKAQDITVKTAEIYKDILNQQRQKVINARENSQKDLQLAANTYATVQISSELLSILKESKNSFDVLMNSQAPEIIPFENLEIQKRFEEMSVELSQKD